MENLEQALNQLLQNPSALSSVMSMLQGVNQPQPVSKPTAPMNNNAPLPQIMAQLELGQKENDSVSTLLSALKPFFSSSMEHKLDRAIQANQLMQMVQLAKSKLEHNKAGETNCV